MVLKPAWLTKFNVDEIKDAVGSDIWVGSRKRGRSSCLQYFCRGHWWVFCAECLVNELLVNFCGKEILCRERVLRNAYAEPGMRVFLSKWKCPLRVFFLGSKHFFAFTKVARKGKVWMNLVLKIR